MKASTTRLRSRVRGASPQTFNQNGESETKTTGGLILFGIAALFYILIT